MGHVHANFFKYFHFSVLGHDKYHTNGATCRPCGAINLKITPRATKIPARWAAHNEVADKAIANKGIKRHQVQHLRQQKPFDLQSNIN